MTPFAAETRISKETALAPPSMPRLFFAFALAFLFAGSAVAQSVPDWASSSTSTSEASEDNFGPGPPPPPPPPPNVPLDGGLGLLALAGAGYAARRLRQRDTE